jgi:hypothetical protein
MWAYGWVFVNMVNCHNPHPTRNWKGTSKDFTLTLVYSILFFFIQGIVILRTPEDLLGYCKVDPIASMISHSPVLELSDSLVLLFESLEKMEYMGLTSHSLCKEYTSFEVF